MPILEKKALLGVNFSIGNYDQVVEIVRHYLRERKPLSVCFTPVHGTVEAIDHPDFRDILNRSDLVMPDGQPIRWALNWRHGLKLKDRVYGPILTQRLLGSCTESDEVKIFLYGGATVGVLQDFLSYIESNHRKVQVVGSYREENIALQTLDLDSIRQTNANLVLVGTGCPIQERWLVENAPKLNCPVLGVGAAFSLLSGNLSMAPKWMQDRGLEWLYRLIKEPKRLWRRYLYTNSRFVLKLLAASLTRD